MTLARDVVRFGDYLPTSEKWYSQIPQIMEMPNLIKVQLDSYEWFTREGLRELLDEISPIQDFTGSKMELRFGEYSFGEPKYDERECRDRDATFAAPLRVKVELIVKETGEVKEQELFMGDFPLMTPTGTFIINGAERVVVSQLVRSPGVYFTREKDPTTGRDLAYRQGDPEPRRLARVRDLEPRRDLGQGRPQAQDPGDHAAARHRQRRRQQGPGARYGRARPAVVRGHRHQPGPPLPRDDRSRRRRRRSRPATSCARWRTSTSACAPATRRRWRTRARW